MGDLTLVRLVEKSGTMTDDWIVAYLWMVSKNWVMCLARERGRPGTLCMLQLHRRVWQRSRSVEH